MSLNMSGEKDIRNGFPTVLQGILSILRGTSRTISGKESVIFEHSCASASPGGLVKLRFSRSHPRDQRSVGLR